MPSGGTFNMRMLIDGAWVDASGGETIEIRNPANGQLIDATPAATVADAERAIAVAQEGKKAMAAMPAHRRAAILMAVAARIRENRDALVRRLNEENGKTFREIDDWEIDAAVRIIEGYAEEAKRLYGHTIPLHGIPKHENALAMTIYQPLGVIAAIVPFNYPVELWSHKVAGGLAAGNAVITKPPEECPLTILEISRYFEEAGLPKGAHQCVTGYGEVVGACFAEAPGVNMISMTGSTEAGRSIARAASASLKKVQLELGGNDATIICADVDPEVAAAAIVSGRFTSGNGQICCAVKRVFVAREIFDEVKDRVVAKTKALKVGDQTLADTDVGPIISLKAAERVEAQVKQAVAEGAKLLIGGERQNQFINPAVLVDVGRDNVVLREEVFGPVLPLVPFDTVDEAISLANASNYGLQAAIFTNDLRSVMAASMKLEVGTVIINHQTAMRIESLPFGGRKLSGNGGREGFLETLKDMSETKTIVIKDAYEVYA